MAKWYRYLEIMNFGDGDKRTSTMSSLYELPKEELGHIHQDYRITLKLTEEEYEEINKLLEYKGEYSYNELKAKVAVLTEKIDKAVEYLKENAFNATFVKSISIINAKDLDKDLKEMLCECEFNLMQKDKEIEYLKKSNQTMLKIIDKLLDILGDKE